MASPERIPGGDSGVSSKCSCPVPEIGWVFGSKLPGDLGDDGFVGCIRCGGAVPIKSIEIKSTEGEQKKGK